MFPINETTEFDCTVTSKFTINSINKLGKVYELTTNNNTITIITYINIHTWDKMHIYDADFQVKMPVNVIEKADQSLNTLNTFTMINEPSRLRKFHLLVKALKCG